MVNIPLFTSGYNHPVGDAGFPSSTVSYDIYMIYEYILYIYTLYYVYVLD